MLEKSFLFCLASFFFMAMGGCCTVDGYAENQPLVSGQEKTEEILEHHPSGKFLVGMAISGGGSRSAIYATYVMKALYEAKPWQNSGDTPEIAIERGKNLMDEVDYLSTCSGGTLAGLYYCMERPAVLSDEFFSQFIREMEQDFESGVLWCDFIRLVTLRSHRTPLMADKWDTMFFDRKTFLDLHKREKVGLCPILIINTAALSHGTPFFLTNHNLKPLKGKPVPYDFMDFDDIQSDIKSYRLSLALAASSAVPGLFLPVTLRDYRSPEDSKQYVHLVDGGVTDNISAQILFQLFQEQLEKNPNIQCAVILVVDASQQPDPSMKKYEGFHEYSTLAGRQALLQSISLMIFRNSQTIRSEMVRYSSQNPKFKAIEIQLPKEVALEIPTRWVLTKEQHTMLKQEAEKAVAIASDEFWKFVKTKINQ